MDGIRRTVLKKIDLMHSKFGTTPGKTCGECENMVEHRYDKKYYKCFHYGLSASVATDWAKKWEACGLFNKEYSGRKGIWFVKHSPKPRDELPECDGQECLF